MSQELLYTSAPRGLKPGTRGFCTVTSTQQMSQPLAERLESLSGYRHLFAAHDAQAKLNPVIYSHLILTIGGRKHHVLSRIADAGLDYTQRSNKLAHHVSLDATELPPGGPAWLLAQPGFMQTDWDGEPKLLQSGRRAPSGFDPPAVCRHWQQLTGDAGWAGALAETAAGPSLRPACLFFRPGQDLLPLVAEALALLPLAQRWNVTFSTWFTKLPPGVDCQWRFLLADSPEAKQARRQPHALFIDLTSPLPNAGASVLAQAARTGIVTAAAQPAAPPPSIAPTAVRAQETVVAANHAPPPVDMMAEYGGRAPIVAQASLPTLRARRPKKRSKLKLAVLAGLAALLMIAAVSGTVVAVHLASNNAEKAIAIVPDPVTAAAEQAAGAESEPHSEAGDTLHGASDADTSGGNSQPPPTNENPPESAEKSADQPAATATARTAGATKLEADVDKDKTAPAMSDTAAANSEPAAEMEASAKNPLAALESTLELPGIKETSQPVLAELPALDAKAVDLELIGWNELTGNQLKYPKQETPQRADWTIKEKFTESNTGLPKPIGTFSLDQGQLCFKWGSASNRALLRSCLLRLSVNYGNRDVEATVQLRHALRLDSKAISFNESLSNISLPVDDAPADINMKLLHIEMMIAETAGAPKPTFTPTDGRAGLDVDVKAMIPFDQGGSIIVSARLEANSTRPPAIVMSYRWKHQVFDHWKGLVDDEIALSIPEVKKCKQGIANNRSAEERSQRLKDREEKLHVKRKERAALKEPKGNDDPDAKKRKELDETIMDLQTEVTKLQQECQYFDKEPRRCDALLSLLNELPARIHLKVYYQLGKGSDEAMRVMLAETGRE